MTSPSPAPVPIETLLEHSGWMRRLAERLVDDAGTAEDVVQETWLASVHNPPRDAATVRGWLSRVLRNKATDARRARRTRLRHESTARTASHAPSVAHSVAEAEELRRLSERVLALDEPYRDVLVVRFYEGLPPREAAPRLGVPVETVRTRTRRALARLRADLDADHAGGRSEWLAALIPFVRCDDLTAGSAGGAITITGVAAMSVKTKILMAATIALVLGLGAGWVAGAAPRERADVQERTLRDQAALIGEHEDRAIELAARLERREAQLRSAQTERDEALATVADLRATLESAEAARAAGTETPSAQDASGAPIEFAAYDTLNDVDWTSVGAATRELVQLLIQLRTAVDEERELPPEVLNGIANNNAPLIAAAARTAGKLPGMGTNGGYASPAFMTNLISATLASGDAPLTAEQVQTLERLALAQIQSESAYTAGVDGQTLELRKLHDEIASRTRYFEAAAGLLSARQSEILRPVAVRDIANLDLFSPAIQWGQSVTPLRHDGTRGSLKQQMQSFIDRNVKPTDEVQEEVRRIVGEWVETLPDEALEAKADGLAAIGMYDGDQVRLSTRLTVELLERIARDVALSHEARERLRNLSTPTVFLQR